MDNKEFHKIAIEAVRAMFADEENGDAINITRDVLKRYEVTAEELETYNEAIDYRGILLSIYYIVSRVQEGTYEYDDDYKDDDGYGVALDYLHKILSRAGISEEYGVYRMRQSEFEKAREKYNLK